MDTVIMFAIIAIIVLAAVALLVQWRQGGQRATPPADGAVDMRDAIETAIAAASRASSSSSVELRSATDRATDRHDPPSPRDRSAVAWSPRTQQLEVAGEYYRAEDLRKLFGRHSRVTSTGTGIREPAVLVPDSRNPFDSNAVAVFVDRLHVGYMERADAAAYHAPIAALPEGQLQVASRQWLREDSTGTWARVTLSLPASNGLACPSPLPPSAVLLPAGSTIQVTQEEKYMDHLRQLLRLHGSEQILAATLRWAQETRARSTVELVAVDIDGSQVGVLSPAQTANLGPLVRRAEELGHVIIARATLRGNELKADVALHTRKAHEISDTELSALFGR